MSIRKKTVEDIERILVIGRGAREHAIIQKLRKDGFDGKILCIPGNAGISKTAQCYYVDISDIECIEYLANLAENFQADLTIVGPEMPLSLGIVDAFEKKGLSIFGPTRKAALLESSKAFSKKLMKENNIPTADFEIFDTYNEALAYAIEAIRKKAPVVIKADGLAAGKGVYICEIPDQISGALNEIMVEKKYGDAGNTVIIEEYLIGEEASFMVFTNGDFILPLATSQDYKKIYDNDKGKNTGGMGAYSPAPIITHDLQSKIMSKIMYPTIEAMNQLGTPFKGILYAGLMINKEKINTLEFNVRLGDPEAQPILMRMKSELLPVIIATITGDLSHTKLEWRHDSAVCVVAASKGYPGDYEQRKIITGLNSADDDPNRTIFHAGTKEVNEQIVTDGGRVLDVTALGKNLKTAIERAYRTMGQIHFDGMHYRKDIGEKGLSSHD